MVDIIKEHMETLRPCNNPTPDAINAAGKQSAMVNSIVAMARVSLQAAKMSRTTPDLRFLGFPSPEEELKK